MRAEEEEEEEEEGEQGRPMDVDGPAPAPGKAETTRHPPKQLPAQSERSHRDPLEYVPEPPALVPHQLQYYKGDNYLSELDSSSQFRNGFPAL